MDSEGSPEKCQKIVKISKIDHCGGPSENPKNRPWEFVGQLFSICWQRYDPEILQNPSKIQCIWIAQQIQMNLRCLQSVLRPAQYNLILSPSGSRSCVLSFCLCRSCCFMMCCRSWCLVLLCCFFLHTFCLSVFRCLCMSSVFCVYVFLFVGMSSFCPAVL